MRYRKYKLTDIILIAAEAMIIFAAIIFSYITAEIGNLLKYRDDSGYKYNDSMYIYFSPKYYYSQYKGQEVIIDVVTDEIAGDEVEMSMTGMNYLIISWMKLRDIRMERYIFPVNLTLIRW